MTLAASGTSHAATLFLELGAVALAMALLARLAAALGITAIPLYLLGGLAVGTGGIAPLDVSGEFISLVAEIGVLLLLFALGLEYHADELRAGLRGGVVPGAVDAVCNFLPGFAAGFLLGWGTTPAVLLGGVTWVSSSGIVAKVLTDLDRLANRETPSVLDLLVVEDLAMAVYLPVAAALAAGEGAAATVATVSVAVAVVAMILTAALRFGGTVSRVLVRTNDEALLLAVFGLTLVVAGIAQSFDVSAAIGAFLVGVALSGPVQERVAGLVAPLRDLFAAVFFLFFSFQIDPAALARALVPALLLAVVALPTKIVTGWIVAGRAGVRTSAGRLRAGTVLTARGEFSIVVASLGAGVAHADDLRAVAAAFVLTSAVVGPVLARFADTRA